MGGGGDAGRGGVLAPHHGRPYVAVIFDGGVLPAGGFVMVVLACSLGELRSWVALSLRVVADHQAALIDASASIVGNVPGAS